MITEYLFTSRRFRPAAGELNEKDEDYINPGVFAKELAEFLIDGLARDGYILKARVVEDWGNWVEFQHSGGFELAICCSNLEDIGEGKTVHRVATVPDKPYVRKLLRKIDVRADVEKLSAALYKILSDSVEISEIQNGP